LAAIGATIPPTGQNRTGVTVRRDRTA
jgi:hypothetical protein